MKERKKSMFAVVLFAGIMFMVLLPIPVNKGSGISGENHPQPGIWEYENVKTQPSEALVLLMEEEQWQFTAAACMTPVFFNRYGTTPLFFDDGSEERRLEIAHTVETVSSFGSDVATVTSTMATTYWTKAEIAIITHTYEQVLWFVPLAGFLSAPILISPSQSTLDSLGTRSAIIMGVDEPDVEEVIVLDSRKELWKFQIELFNTKGQICNYVILTNPQDTDITSHSNIKWPYMSLASAPLAAYRNAVLQTGDWTADKSDIESLELCTVKVDDLYNEVKPFFERVKDDSYEAEKFLLDNSHTPEYLAVVGGPYAVPNYFYDIQVNYRYPLNNPQQTVYPSSIAAYATLQENVPKDEYLEEDLAAGRIMTSSLFDASKQLMKTFFYREFLPGGEYHSKAPSAWETTASIIDGHRLNQPEPDNLIWDPDEPYHPSDEVEDELTIAGMDTTYYLPRNESDPFDTNLPILDIMDEVTASSLVQLLPHGGKTNLRIEVGIDTVTGEGQSTYLESDDVRDLRFKAPTIVYTGSCKGANPFMLDEDLKIKDFVTSAFIHAGCVAYIATPEIQSTCFWREAPYGVSTQQTVYFWENLLNSNMPIGKALRDAKWDAHQWAMDEWPSDASDSPIFNVDSLIYHLFGDPALEPYKPNIPYSNVRDMDVTVTYSTETTDETLDVIVDVSSLDSGFQLSDAHITIKFNGITATGPNASFDLPKGEGIHDLEVSVQNSGYEDKTVRYHIYLEGGDGEDYSVMIQILLVIIFVLSVVFLTIKALRKR